jgi:glycosyltransferase involved in cell wall biosynthesis
MRRTVGIYDLWINGGGGGQKKACVLADHLSRKHDVWLITGEEFDLRALEAYYGVDLSKVRVCVLRRPILKGIRRAARSAPVRNLLNGQKHLETLDRLAELSLYPQFEALRLDVFLNTQWASRIPCPAPRGFYMCMFPHPMKDASLPLDSRRSSIARLRLRAANQWLGMSRPVLDSYTAVTANSTFTSHWIEKMWGVRAPVIYSSCERMGPPAPKDKIILNVGRFVGADRADDKHQATMFETFRKMTSLHAQGWQLHFAGTILQGPSAKKRTQELVDAARGLPVFFHFNAAFAALRDLYRRSSIYWHATGYGSSVDSNPEMQEHFGQTTVEAMSAGVVPVVINTGGQREIVTHSSDGFLWDDLAGLAAHTQRLAADAKLRACLSDTAIRSSERFSRQAFGERVEQLIAAG